MTADVRSAGERIEQLLDGLAASGPVARNRAEELVRVVVELYGAGLERVLEIVDGGGALTDATVAALADDELVAGLLVVHGLHPYSVAQRVERALDSVRPYLASHGGDVELLGVDLDGADDGAVLRLRLLGHCDGCDGSTATLRSAVESAVEAAAPEVARIEVAEPTAPAHPAPASPVRAVIPVESLTARIRS